MNNFHLFLIENNIVYQTDSHFKSMLLTHDFFEYESFRAFVHPLSIILLKPLVQTLYFHRIFLILTMQAICASASMCFFFKILNKIFDNFKKSLLLTLFLGFSYSILIFTSVIEYYTFSLLFMMALIYYILNLNDKISNKDLFVISFLCTLNFGIDIYNIILSFIIIYVLRKDVNFLKLIGFIIFHALLLNSLQIIFYNFSFFSGYTLSYKSMFDYEILLSKANQTSFNILHNIKNVYNFIFCNGFIAYKFIKEIKALPMITVSNNPTLYSLLPISILYLYPIIKNLNNLKNLYNTNNLFRLSTIMIVFQSICYIFYGNAECFLYSLKILPFVIIAIAFLFKDISEDKIALIFLPLTIFEIIINYISIVKIEKIAEYFFRGATFVPEKQTLLTHAFILGLASIIFFKNKKINAFTRNGFNLVLSYYIIFSVILLALACKILY